MQEARSKSIKGSSTESKPFVEDMPHVFFQIPTPGAAWMGRGLASEDESCRPGPVHVASQDILGYTERIARINCKYKGYILMYRLHTYAYTYTQIKLQTNAGLGTPGERREIIIRIIGTRARASRVRPRVE